MVIEFAAQRDLDPWMRLVRSVKDSFPGLETEKALTEHRKTVLEFTERNEALCAKEEGRVVGALLFLRGAVDALFSGGGCGVPQAA